MLHGQQHDRPWVRRQIDRQHLESEATGIEIDDRIWKRRNEFPTGKQISTQMNGQGFQAHLGHTSSSLARWHGFLRAARGRLVPAACQGSQLLEAASELTLEQVAHVEFCLESKFGPDACQEVHRL